MKKSFKFLMMLTALATILYSCKPNGPENVVVTGVTVSPTTLTLQIGATAELTAAVTPENATNKNVTWESSDTTIALVDTTGKVQAIKAGTATITVTTEDGQKTATCAVTVNNITVTGVAVSPTTLTLDIGTTSELTATVSPEDATNKNVTWESSDITVATVDIAGKVKAINTGTATITVTTEDGQKTATCAVTVTDKKPTTVKRDAAVIEDFTGDWCGPCYAGMKNIQKVLANYEFGKAILVCHHLSDAFAISESKILSNAYKISGIPSCMLNRTPGVYGPTINFHPGYLTKAMVDKQLAVETSVFIGIQTSYSESSKELKVKVAGNLLSELPNARLNVYLVQDSIIAYQNGGGNSYAHRNALRKVLSEGGAWGETLGVTSGVFSKQYTYTVPEKIGKFATDISKMYVVAFVTDHFSTTTTDMPKNIVHNATITKIK